MKKLAFIFTSFCLASLCGYAQQYNNIFFAGDSILINFSGPTPNASCDATLFSYESSGSICDADGNLQFIANHEEVRDRFGDPMLNGSFASVLGSASITQGIVILPDPDRHYIYHLLRKTYALSLSDKLLWSVIDMTGNGGKGIVTSIKDSVAFSDYPLNEKMAAVKDAEAHDYWILSHIANSDSFVVHRLTSSGLVFSHYQRIGQTQYSGVGDDGDFGEMTFSPLGDQLVLTTALGIVDIFSFDRCSGMLSNHRAIKNYGSGKSYYGCSFSPNNRFLYVSDDDAITGSLVQFDTQAPDIAASEITLWTTVTPDLFLGQHELAPDGRIYIASMYGSYWPNTFHNSYNQAFHFIEFPDLPGTASSFMPFGLTLSCGRSQVGLPNYPNFNLGPWVLQEANAGRDTSVVSAQSAFLIGTPDSTGSLYSWTPSMGLSSTTIAQPIFDPSGLVPGFYTYYLTVTDPTKPSCNVTLDTITIKVFETPVADAGKDTAVCLNGSPITIGSSNTPFFIYQWEPSIGISNLSLAQPYFDMSLVGPGFHTLILGVQHESVPEYISYDSVIIEVPMPPSVDAGADVQGCIEDGLYIGGASDPAYTYYWSSSEYLESFTTTPTRCMAPQDMLFVLTGENNSLPAGCRIATDTVKVLIDPCDSIQNVVTPNGDGINDYFVVNGFGPGLKVTITDRWGDQIFSSLNYQNNWPSPNNSLPLGVYFYLVEGTYLIHGDELIRKSGNLTVIH